MYKTSGQKHALALDVDVPKSGLFTKGHIVSIIREFSQNGLIGDLMHRFSNINQSSTKSRYTCFQLFTPNSNPVRRPVILALVKILNDNGAFSGL